MTRHVLESGDDHVTEFLIAYVNGTLDSQMTAHVHFHVQQCPACRIEWQAWDRIAMATRIWVEATVNMPGNGMATHFGTTTDEDQRLRSFGLSDQELSRPGAAASWASERWKGESMETWNRAGAMPNQNRNQQGRFGMGLLVQGWRIAIGQLAWAALLLIFLTAGYAAYRALPSSHDHGPSIPAAIQAEIVATSIVPAPSECRVAARTTEEYLGLLGIPGPGTPYPLAQTYDQPLEEPTSEKATPTPPSGPQHQTYGLPPGEPAGSEVIAAITATWREFWACIAADDPARAAALFTDAGLGRIGDPPLVGFLGLPSAPHDYPYRVHPYPYHLIEARILPDGRVAAMFDANPPLDPSVSGTYAVQYGVVFFKTDDRWLIDEFGRATG